MEILFDPSLWVGLLTLVILEIVLGIDNLIFIAILAEKLPPNQRDKARIMGLSLALLMRLGLLSLISWLVTLTNPLFHIGPLDFSGRDLILFFGGIFLLYKAVSELHEKLEGEQQYHEKSTSQHAQFGLVVTQIVILDAVFSLDSVITAVGMVDELAVMMAAVIIAIIIMLIASKPLMSFVNRHPTVVILCLSFLLMIGISLIADGLGFHIPKGYIYSGIGFAILIEIFNQYAQINRLKHQKRVPLRDKAAHLIYRLMSGKPDSSDSLELIDPQMSEAFIPEERYMMSGVLSLADRPVSSIMIAREEISWINIRDDLESIRQQILSVPHNLLPLCDGDLDHVISVVRAKSLMNELEQIKQDSYLKKLKEPIWIKEDISVIDCMKALRQAKGSLLMVRNDQQQVCGLVTPLDLLEAIAGDFPDSDELPDVEPVSKNQWIVQGDVDFYQLQQELGLIELSSIEEKELSIEEHLKQVLGKRITVGSQWKNDEICLTIKELQNGRIRHVLVEKLLESND